MMKHIVKLAKSISEATTIIKNGDKLAIDGYLGLVTVIAALKN